MPQSPQLHWAVASFRWIVSGLDIASGLGFARLGLLVLFDASNWGLFRAIPTGWLGVLILGHGIWAVFSGVMLIREQPPMSWWAGKRRHLIAAMLSGLTIALLWLALLVETSRYSPDGLGLGIGMFLYTTVFGCVAGYFLLVVAVMSRLTGHRQLDNSHDS